MISKYNGENMNFFEFAGTPEEMGKAHSKAGLPYLKKKLSYMFKSYKIKEEDLDNCDWYKKYREDIIRFHAKEFPHLVEEAEAIAEHSELSRDRVMDNVFDCYGIIKSPRSKEYQAECSLIGLNCREGYPIMLSTLDDTPEIWQMIVRYKPSDKSRHTFVTTAYPGSPAAGRGMNRAGLWLGSASGGIGPLPDSPYSKKRYFHMGFVFRAILEQCSDVRDVISMCKYYNLSCNLLVGDKKGNLSAIVSTSCKVFELSGEKVLTNTVPDDYFSYVLSQESFKCYEAVETSRPRRGFLIDIYRKLNNNCEFEEFLDIVTGEDTGKPWAINNKGTVYITAAKPAASPNLMWVRRPSDPVYGKEFIEIQIVPE
jgi:predicted choloylglycine hydrolase